MPQGGHGKGQPQSTCRAPLTHEATSLWLALLEIPCCDTARGGAGGLWGDSAVTLPHCCPSDDSCAILAHSPPGAFRVPLLLT